jgi:hypothetical protein
MVLAAASVSVIGGFPKCDLDSNVMNLDRSAAVYFSLLRQGYRI